MWIGKSTPAMADLLYEPKGQGFQEIKAHFPKGSNSTAGS